VSNRRVPRDGDRAPPRWISGAEATITTPDERVVSSPANTNVAVPGLVGPLLVARIIPSVSPEPATARLGITLVALAVVVWAVQEFL
jgi:small neutral amino acid transporter SnatA (MarC family)